MPTSCDWWVWQGTGTDLSKGWVFTQSVLKADDFSEKSEAGWARVEPRAK